LIYIDYIAGAHGNYLEFVCNTFMAGVRSTGSIFSDVGAAHAKKYIDPKVFTVWQHVGGSYAPLVNQQVIAITFAPDDLLPLQAVSMLRAGNFDVDELEVDTYNKLNRSSYVNQLAQIQQSYFQDTRVEGYQIVRSDHWPVVQSVAEFEALPVAIKTECERLHGLVKLELSADYPDCPRWILRDFFKHGFLNSSEHGMVLEDQNRRSTYSADNSVYEFPFASFYQTEQFVQELQKLAAHFGFEFDNNNEFGQLHQEFTQRQHYAIIKQQCDQLVEDTIAGNNVHIPHMNLLMESYIEACVEHHYKQQLPTGRNTWFTNTQQIQQALQ